MPGTTPSGETARLPMSNLHVRLRLSLSLELLQDDDAAALPANSWPIDERVHHYQRGRASITGLGLWSGKIIETERLVVVVTARLVVLLLFFTRVAVDHPPQSESESRRKWQGPH